MEFCSQIENQTHGIEQQNDHKHKGRPYIAKSQNQSQHGQEHAVAMQQKLNTVTNRETILLKNGKKFRILYICILINGLTSSV